jgi:anti-anti-sigma factor
MSTRRHENGPVVVLGLRGDYFGGPETDVLGRAIADEIARGNVLLLLDLRECRSMNSTAFGVLIEARRACAARGGALKLCGAERRIRSLLDVLHAEHLIEGYATEAEALVSFAQRASA